MGINIVLAQKIIDRKIVDSFLESVFGEADNTRNKNIHDNVINLFEHGKGNNGKTLWDLYNGVTEYIDHERGSDLEKRERSAVYGSGFGLKAKAYNTAMSLV